MPPGGASAILLYADRNTIQWVIHGSCKSNGVWMRFGSFGNSQGNSSRSSSLQGSLASHPAQLHLKLFVNESRSRKNRIR